MKKRERKVTEEVVGRVQWVRVQVLVGFNEMSGRVTWPVVHAVAGIAAQSIESLGHSVSGVYVEMLEAGELVTVSDAAVGGALEDQQEKPNA